MKDFKKELIDLKKYGKAVFEDKSYFESWLKSKSKALGDVTPESLLENVVGIEKVRDALKRIEHGILS